MEQGSLYTHTENGIATLEFYHPASNSLPSNLLQRMVNSLNELSEDNNVRVIILKSEKDRVFCAGASFDELVHITTLDEGVQFFSGFAK